MRLDPQKFALAGTTAYIVYLVLLLVIPPLISDRLITINTTLNGQNILSLLIMCGINYIFYYVLAQSYNRYSSDKKKRRNA